MSLINGTLIPPTKIYRDKNGNIIGTSTDITPSMMLFAKAYAYLYYFHIILIPFLAPIYFLAVRWYCNRFDAINMAENPTDWPTKKQRIKNRYTSILIIWIVYMAYG